MKKNKVLKMVLFLVISLIPLWLYGFYKNGVFLYSKGLINFVQLLKPLIIPLLGILLGILINYLFRKKKEINYFYSLYGLILGMIVSLNTPYWLFIIVCLGMLTFLKVIPENKINIICIGFIIIYLLNLLLSNNFENIYEATTVLNYNFFDKLFGKGVGGLASTNILLILVGYFFLCFQEGYKKEIPLSFFFTYFITTILISLISSDINCFSSSFSNSLVMFSIIYIAPLPELSPRLKKYRIIYGLFLGIIIGIFNIFMSLYLVSFISILLINISMIITNRFTKKSIF